MIKVAFVIDTIHSPTAGTERQLLLLLRNLDRSRFSPMLCCLRSSEWLAQEFDLCPLHIIGIDSFKSPFVLKQLRSFSCLLKQNEVLVVQTFFKDSNIAGVIAARLAGIKAIISSRRGVPYWNGTASLRFLQLLNCCVAAFIANCQTTRQWVSRKEGVPLDRIRVIYNALDAESFREVSPETRARYRKELAIPSDAPVIGIVANLRPVKGIDLFLRSAHLVHKRVPEARFVIVGDDTERERLIALSEELGLQKSVMFLGKRFDVIPLLSAFDVGVLSSRFESFPNAVVEYLAAGLPVVCTDVGGCREVVRDGVNGYVVPVGDYEGMADAIVTALQGRQPFASRSPNAEMLDGTFSVAATVAHHEEFYTSVLHATGSGAAVQVEIG